MLPSARLGEKQGKKLFVYGGAEHPHAAQQPENYRIPWIKSKEGMTLAQVEYRGTGRRKTQ